MASSPRITVGAIRWDGWSSTTPQWEKNLQAPQWHGRLPFHALKRDDGHIEVRGDNQEVMDREIAYAVAARLDYWAFCYYHPTAFPNAGSYNYGLELYLKSAVAKKLGFCLILQGPHLGPPAKWNETAAALAAWMRHPLYQREASGRPLLYFYALKELRTHFGAAADAARALDQLRAACRGADGLEPYLVAQTWDPQEGIEAIRDLGFDAIGAYSASGVGGPHEQRPYADLRTENEEFWRRCEATGRPFIPTLNSGWDARPRFHDPQLMQWYVGSWFEQPTREELRDHLRNALQWINRHSRAVPARTLLIYAWNETDEGGWLVPGLDGDARRLDALRIAMAASGPH